jgi:hypothetical protein
MNTVINNTLDTKLAAFCERHHICKLAVFGSVLRSDFQPDSDIDVLVEFEQGYIPDFFRLYDIEQELSEIYSGHPVDLVTYAALNPRLRESVIASAKVQYEQG